MEIKFLQKRKKIIAIENGKVIGHLRFNYPNDHSNRRNINIDDIYVKPEYRRKGIATQMIQTFLDNSRGKIVWASLWTNEEMETNKTYGLYKKHWHKAFCKKIKRINIYLCQSFHLHPVLFSLACFSASIISCLYFMFSG